MLSQPSDSQLILCQTLLPINAPLAGLCRDGTHEQHQPNISQLAARSPEDCHYPLLQAFVTTVNVAADL